MWDCRNSPGQRVQASEGGWKGNTSDLVFFRFSTTNLCEHSQTGSDFNEQKERENPKIGGSSKKNQEVCSSFFRDDIILELGLVINGKAYVCKRQRSPTRSMWD